MSEEREHIWTDGLFYNQPNEKAPEWILGSLSVEPKLFVEWLRKHYDKNEKYVKIDIKMGKTGKPYTELNTYKPTQGSGQGGGRPGGNPQQSGGNSGGYHKPPPPDNAFEDDIPF